MRVLRVLVAMSVLSTMQLSAAQVPAAKPAAGRPATAKSTTAATSQTAASAATEDGSPAPISPFPQGPPTKAGLQLIAIHTADRKWRESQRGYVDPRRLGRFQPKQLPAVDPATQEKTYDHLKGVQDQIDKLAVSDMSESERMNLEIFRYQIVTQRNAQKFKEWEKPVTSLGSFWAGAQNTGLRGFRTEQDYLNYLQWLADLPRYYEENIANMRAGLARGYTPPKVTLTGRDKTISMIANAKSADQPLFWIA